MPTARNRIGRSWPMAALVVAGAARTVFADAHPEAGTTAASMAIGCAWAAALLFALARRERVVPSIWRAMLAGAILLGGPLLPVLLLGVVPVDPGVLTIALALTAVVVAVASAAMSGVGEDVPGRLWPSLAGVGGLLLVLVTPGLKDLRADLVMVLSPVVAGVGAVWLAELRGDWIGRMRWALVGASTVFLLAALVGWGCLGRPMVSVAAVAWDGVLAALGLLVLARLGAVRWSAQFVLLPLAVLLIGVVFMRPQLDWRMVLGLGLIAAAGVYLLWSPDDVEARLGR